MKNVNRFLLAFILVASTSAFAQTGPPIPTPGPTPILHPVPGRMPPGLVSQITPPIILVPPTAPMAMPECNACAAYSADAAQCAAESAAYSPFSEPGNAPDYRGAAYSADAAQCAAESAAYSPFSESGNAPDYRGAAYSTDAA